MGAPRCLCQICTCGRHHCPHVPTKIYDHGGDASLMSEYVDKFLVYGNAPPAQSCKPKQEYRSHGGKMETITTSRSDYLPYELPRRPVRPQEEYKRAAGEMDLGTTYRRDYNIHPVQPVILVKPMERNYVRGGKLDTIPTYQADYRVWEIPRREPHQPAESAYRPPTEKFGNTTTFQDAFVPRELAPPRSFKPAVAARLSSQPFAGLTSHRSDYVPHPLEPKPRRAAAEDYKPSGQPFEASTTHRRDFRGLPGELARSFKPEPPRVSSTKAPFESSTEFRERFQPWAVSLPEVRKAREYVPPGGGMDLNTTSRLDYIPHAARPATPVRPAERGRRHHAPFDGRTTMREAFQAWEACRPEIVKKAPQLSKPSGKFDPTTTFRAHYVPYDVAPQKSCRPPRATAAANPAPFEDQTMYRTEYTPKRVEVCPATYPSPPGYVYVSTDSRGHKFFRRVTPEARRVAPANGNHLPKEIAVMA